MKSNAYAKRIAEAVREAAVNVADSVLYAATCAADIRSLDLDAIIASVPNDYEGTFQHDVTELVMHHIDRMNDVCEQDTADRIIESFTSQFAPIFEVYMAAKFPRRFATLSQSEAPAEQPEIIVSAQSFDEQRRMDQKFTLPELVGNIQCMVRNSQAAFDGFGPEWASDLAKQSVELLEEYSDTLRSLACSLSAGGWNSEGLIHPKIAEDKIRWGIDYLLQAAKRDALTQAPQEPKDNLRGGRIMTLRECMDAEEAPQERAAVTSTLSDEQARQWAKYIVRHPEKDHACEECGGSTIFLGFRCVFHEALALLSLAQSSEGKKP
jgi:hypothetical protein